MKLEWTWQELEEKEDCEELAKVTVVTLTPTSGHRRAEGGVQANN